MQATLQNFVDAHCHILPGLDDGAHDVATSIALARCYEDSGVRTVVATPHYLPGTAWNAGKERILSAVRALQEEFDRNELDLTVLPGMEIALHRKLEKRLQTDELLPLGTSTCYLVEPPFRDQADYVQERLLSLLEKRYEIIIAHPERTELFQRRSNLLERLVERGARLQINCGSLLGSYGGAAEKLSHRLWQQDMVHFIASDAHDAERRAPLTRSQWSELGGLPDGARRLRTCVENSRRLLQ